MCPELHPSRRLQSFTSATYEILFNLSIGFSLSGDYKRATDVLANAQSTPPSPPHLFPLLQPHPTPPEKCTQFLRDDGADESEIADEMHLFEAQRGVIAHLRGDNAAALEIFESVFKSKSTSQCKLVTR
jgi:hypothetical protein